jgi:kinesin family protein C2/C3
VVAGALELEITSASEAMAAVARGFSARKTHKTLTNPRSSRSHLLLTVYVDVTGRNSRSGGLSHRSSRMMFVDLAGSERVHKSLSSGDRLKEAQHINRSLSALGDILAALTSKSRSQTHVPYRNAKLTHLLQPCIGGDSKTLMVACICPHVPQRHNLGETLSTLAFAARARCVENKVPPVASAIRNGPAVASGRRAND